MRLELWVIGVERFCAHAFCAFIPHLLEAFVAAVSGALNPFGHYVWSIVDIMPLLYLPSMQHGFVRSQESTRPDHIFFQLLYEVFALIFALLILFLLLQYSKSLQFRSDELLLPFLLRQILSQLLYDFLRVVFFRRGKGLQGQLHLTHSALGLRGRDPRKRFLEDA